jgi:hypothetical protein
MDFSKSIHEFKINNVRSLKHPSRKEDKEMKERIIDQEMAQIRTRFVGVAVDVDFAEKIKEAARREEISLSQLCRKALVQYVVGKTEKEKK